LEGIVCAPRYHSDGRGKQFLGTVIECSDGRVWICDYAEQSPFHLFDGRRVEALGKPYVPTSGQHLIGWGGEKALGHFYVSSMRLLDVTCDAKFVEIRAAQDLHGRFERGLGDTGESTLSFVTEEGNTFHVANDPAGATVGPSAQVCAYLVRPSPSVPTASKQYLWIICPYSAVDLWGWRERNS
jgi:hypothetical protein